MRTTIVTGLTIVLALVTNYAAELGPDWTRNPWIIWPLLAVTGMLTVVATVVNRSRATDRAAVPRLESTRPPALDVRVRGRAAELSRLLEMVRNPRGRFAVICGLGGNGKSTLAAELATRVKVPVWWIRFTDPDSFAGQLRQIAESLGATVRHGQSLPDVVWSALSSRKRWLLVVDNLDRPELLSPTGEPLAEYRGWVRTGGRGLLLITSRDADSALWGPGAELINLDTLSIEDGAAVLLDAAPHAGDRAQAEALAARLGAIPLALRFAGHGVSQPTARYRTFDGYRVALDDELGELLAAPHAGPLTTEQRRALLRYTYELSVDQVVAAGFPQARALMRILSLGADAPLPRDLVTPGLVKGRATPAAVDGALAGLHRYGLVGTRSIATIDCVTMHALVREITATVLAEETDIRPWQANLDRILLAAAEQAAGTGRAGWDRVQVLVPHLAPVIAHQGTSQKAVRSACRKLISIANALEGVGTAHSRAVLFSSVHAGLVVIDALDQPNTVGILSKLGLAYSELGDFHTAADLHRRAAISYQRLLGPGDPNTLGERSNYAAALHNLNELRESERLQSQTVADCHLALYPGHPHTMISSRHLAHVRGDLAHLARHSVALEPAETIPQPESTRHDPLSGLHVLGALEIVRSSCRDALTYLRREAGTDHADTVLARNLLIEIGRHMDLVRSIVEQPGDDPVEVRRLLDAAHLCAIRAGRRLGVLGNRATVWRWARSWRALSSR